MWLLASFLLYEDQIVIKYPARIWKRSYEYYVSEIVKIEVQTSDSGAFPQLSIYLKNSKKFSTEFFFDSKKEFQNFINQIREQSIPVEIKSKGRAVFKCLLLLP